VGACRGARGAFSPRPLPRRFYGPVLTPAIGRGRLGRPAARLVVVPGGVSRRFWSGRFVPLFALLRARLPLSPRASVTRALGGQGPAPTHETARRIPGGSARGRGWGEWVPAACYVLAGGRGRTREASTLAHVAAQRLNRSRRDGEAKERNLTNQAMTRRASNSDSRQPRRSQRRCNRPAIHN
jgi:hypothetical protein